MDKLGPFLDLPLLFFPFTTSTFYFKSELVAPTSVNGERYMMSCILAAERFIEAINKKISGGKKDKSKLTGNVSISGVQRSQLFKISRSSMEISTAQFHMHTGSNSATSSPR